MRIRLALGLSAVLALAFAAVAIAAPKAPFKVTGGGQTFASTAVDEAGKPTVRGPGDTITFQAFIQQPDEETMGAPATGQVNIIDRPQNDSGQSTSGKGTHFKGTVHCAYLVTGGTGGGYAELHGEGRAKDGDVTPFVVRIMDNGQGAVADPDQVEFDFTDPSPECDEAPDDTDFEFTLARGNAKIHKQSPSQAGARSTNTAGTSVTRSLTSSLTLR
jgi:hypothetical protein